MSKQIEYGDFDELYEFASQLALALADEVMYLGSLTQDGASSPTDNTLNLLSEARDKLDLADVFDSLDELKPLLKAKA